MKKIFVNKKLAEADNKARLKIGGGGLSSVPPAELNKGKRAVVQTAREKYLKKQLQAILRDDGQGHHHAKFAKRLDDFFIFVVNHKKNPDMTACISFDRSLIKISDAFFIGINSDDKEAQKETYRVLSAIIRHELLHNLLMHEIRLINKLGPEASEHLSYSMTLSDLQNIICDMDVSNQGYSAEDKNIIRTLKLNGRTIGGIVTEDWRKGWDYLSLEEMYNKVCQESKTLAEYWKTKYFSMGSQELQDYESDYNHDRERYRKGYINIVNTLTEMTGYKDEKALEELIYQPIDNFKLSKDYQKFKASGLVKDLDEIVDSLHAVAKNLTQDEIKALYNQVVDSDPVNEVQLRNPKTKRMILTIYTPEEKFLAAAVLHALDLFPVKKYWEERVENVFTQLPQYTEYSKDELKKILDGINK